jgi:hypothetical protein
MDDDFVPEGRVPLKSAIERVAGARQTNVTSVQAEFRTKLHSGSIAAQAMDRNTGRMFDIIPDTWATETALYWLESGTCLLPNEDGKVRITTERFGMFYGPENATIFILESDVQRLIGPASKREARRTVTSDAEARRHFEEWRKRRGDDIPSLNEDANYMRQFGVSRDRVRKLRKSDGVVNLPRGRSRRTAPNRRIK